MWLASCTAMGNFSHNRGCLFFLTAPRPVQKGSRAMRRSRTKKSAVSDPSDKPKTDALKNLEANLELLISFLNGHGCITFSGAWFAFIIGRLRSGPVPLS
jgi:hypothetical protein